jgi:murein L,D-transpeptidase YcbB/YkuD
LPKGAGGIRQAIAEVEKDGLRPADYHLETIDSLLAGKRSHEVDADLEILMTDAVASLIDHARYGRVLPTSLNPMWNVDPREGSPPLEQTLAEIAAAPDPGQAIEQAKIDHFIYEGLKETLARLRAVQEEGGWPTVPLVRGGLKPGAVHLEAVPQVRKRLAATGELPAGASLDAPQFDQELVEAVKLFQGRHRLTDDGVVDGPTVHAMNVSVGERIGQVRVNLERARWVLPGLQGDFLLVNLPGFKTYLISGNKNVWEARIMIGKEARQTPAFRAPMITIIFNPDWTVPPTILEEDILAGMKEGDEDIIAKKQLVILDPDGSEVDPGSIDWDSARPESFPYTLRQPPGPANALGRVKFVIANEWDIYLHDTPSKELFAAEERTFSSGCIRVENALDLARVLLEGKRGWDAARIQEVLEEGTTQPVSLPEPLPVLIVYWTVSVGASGEVRFARDVYDLDPSLLRALDGPLAPPGTEGGKEKSAEPS